MNEIIWLGRGGQGIVTAAEITASSAFNSGIKDVNVVPSFGAERRGAPVTAFLRLSDNEINVYSSIKKADYIILLDHTLIEQITSNSIKKNKTILILNANTKISNLKTIKQQYNFKSIYYIDAVKISEELNLRTSESLIINTPMIGSFVKSFNSIKLEQINKSLTDKLGKKRADLNFQAVEKAYSQTEIL